MKTPLSVAVAQLDCVVGDISGNARRILDAATRAKAAGADVLLTPELALCGYPPEDLLLRPAFLDACAEELDALAAQVQGITVLVGYPAERAGERFNAAAVIQDGRVARTYFKHRLPNYEVFDEERYFEPGHEACVFELKGVRVGVNICADVWESGAADVARGAGAELLLVLNASPFHMYKQGLRYEVLRERIADTGLPVVYCNLVGGQDELVFDGGSFVVDRGEVQARARHFDEQVLVVDVDVTVGVSADVAGDGSSGVGPVLAVSEPAPGRDSRTPVDALVEPSPAGPEEIWDALVLGTRDYVTKNGFTDVTLGLSGGVDSALVCAIAADAVGAERVHAVLMPSRYSSDHSLADAHHLASNLGVDARTIPIEAAHAAFLELLAPSFGERPPDLTEENLQSRVRGVLLMALSNKFGWLVLTTGNKSETAVGYSTLYGDSAGGFAVIKDCPKTLVFRLMTLRAARADAAA